MTISDWCGHRWFRVKTWWLSIPDRMARFVASNLPRHIALLAFVRVCAANGDGPDQITYESAYKAWEKGVGK